MMLPPILTVPASVMQRCILPNLDARGLCALQVSCKELREETTAESLWKERLLADFPSYFIDGVGGVSGVSGVDGFNVDGGGGGRGRALYPAWWSAQRAYALMAEGPSKWVKRAAYERFSFSSYYHAVIRHNNNSNNNVSGGGGNNNNSNNGGGGDGTPALCLHSHEGTLVAGFADGYVRMFERRGGDDQHEDEHDDDDDEENERRRGEGRGRRGGGGGGGGGGDDDDNNDDNNDNNNVGWYLREPCPTRAAHMGGMVTCMDSCRGRLVSAGSDATVAVFDSDTGVELAGGRPSIHTTF